MGIRIVVVRRGVEVKFSSKLLKENYKKCEHIRKKLEIQNELRPLSFFLVALDKNIVVGFLYAYTLSVSGELMYHSTAVLESIMVEPNYRNTGIATSLLETFLDLCLNYNIKILETEKIHESKCMMHLYWKLNLRKYFYRMRMDYEEEK